ncbi:CinA family protein [Kineococcus sp. SYSU DK002]|uniref:CinA family protein n=1 Tax=Kineococcus sp. SYSU DK002 TaxID=3383123 RepID=UPI003D7E3C33
MTSAPDVVAALTAARVHVATAESLTGGLLCATLVDVPGASAVVRGGVVAYATELKTALLGVPADALARTGPVDAFVAEEMARGARARLGADLGVATTGVAGPGPADGFDAGTVFLGVAAPWLPGGARHVRLALTGDRARIRRETVRAALAAVAAALADRPARAEEQDGPSGS